MATPVDPTRWKRIPKAGDRLPSVDQFMGIPKRDSVGFTDGVLAHVDMTGWEKTDLRTQDDPPFFVWLRIGSPVHAAFQDGLGPDGFEPPTMVAVGRRTGDRCEATE